MAEKKVWFQGQFELLDTDQLEEAIRRMNPDSTEEERHELASSATIQEAYLALQKALQRLFSQKYP